MKTLCILLLGLVGHQAQAAAVHKKQHIKVIPNPAGPVQHRFGSPMAPHQTLVERERRLRKNTLHKNVPLNKFKAIPNHGDTKVDQGGSLFTLNPWLSLTRPAVNVTKEPRFGNPMVPHQTLVERERKQRKNTLFKNEPLNKFQGNCSSTEFKCPDQDYCYPDYWICDGYNDCSDGSDEADCETCSYIAFKCEADDTCVYYGKCNGYNECSDGSDEADCNVTNATPGTPTEVTPGTTMGQPGNCSSTEFKCPGWDSCYPNYWICDGIIDCSDGSDEADCDGTNATPDTPTEVSPGTTMGQTVNCSSSEYKCPDQDYCIPDYWICDGVTDCSDGSDEADCKTCSYIAFKCEADDTCVYYGKCNGFNDCSDGSDEADCDVTNATPDTPTEVTPATTMGQPGSCSSNEFKCPGEDYCYPDYWICDGIIDCSDESDEADCETCSISAFKCEADDTCVYYGKCNGYTDCSDGSDEDDCNYTNTTTKGPTTEAPTTIASIKPRETSTSRTFTTETSDEPSEGSDCECGQVNRAHRIVNGIETEVNEYPWQAAMVYSGSSSVFCGGSVIGSKHILTAAHCTQAVTDWGINYQILVGAHGLTTAASSQLRLDPDSFIQYTGYDSSTVDNDISIIELRNHIDFTSSEIRPVCLPANDVDTYDSVTATVSGWGTLKSGGSSPDVLMEVDVPTLSNTQCNSDYGGGITDNMICAGYEEGGKDSCQGDSGGPLIYNSGTGYTQIGVVSWGAGCAQPGYPGVYARVTKYLSWISTVTASSNTCSAAYLG